MHAHTEDRARIRESKQQVKSGLHELIAGAEALLSSTASYGGSELESVRDRLKHQLEAARDQAGGWERSAVERYQRASRVADGYVHENSWKLIGVAIVLGALLGACAMSDHGRRR